MKGRSSHEGWLVHALVSVVCAHPRRFQPLKVGEPCVYIYFWAADRREAHNIGGRHACE